jgi:hypothetical protein
MPVPTITRAIQPAMPATGSLAASSGSERRHHRVMTLIR